MKLGTNEVHIKTIKLKESAISELTFGDLERPSLKWQFFIHFTFIHVYIGMYMTYSLNISFTSLTWAVNCFNNTGLGFEVKGQGQGDPYLKTDFW